MLLSKGKKFCPVEVDPPIVRLQRELNRFYRTLRLEWLFHGQEDKRTELEKKFYPKSDFKPPKASIEIENFIARLQEKFDKWKPSKFVKDNVSKPEREFIKNIKNKKDIVYMWEDKGSSFVKLNRNDYLKAGEKELDNKDVYEVIENDLGTQIKAQNDALVDAMIINDEIPVKVGTFLKDGQCKLSKFYHLTKTHKIPSNLEDPSPWLDQNGLPVRGIVAGIGSPTERLSGFVDHFLQPGMQGLDSFLRDTKHTLKIIEDFNEKIDEGQVDMEGVAIVSMDVESMYSNMSEELATEAVKEYLESRIYLQDGDDVSANSILMALDLCLKNNHFTFNKKVYKQISGVGTGLKLAPTYACLGMGKFEKILFNSNQDLLERILLWKRYIDDVLMLFRGSKSECECLVNWLNSLLPGVVKFKFDFSFHEVEFLDLRISIENGRLKTNIFVKETNKQLFLDFNSNHPEHCKSSIPYSQALRVIERCSSLDEAENHLSNLQTKFEDRNYPADLISEQFDRARKRDRNMLINQQKQKRNGDNKVRLIITHNQTNPPIHMWVRQCKQLLVRNDKAKVIGDRIQIGSKQPKNLQRLVGGDKRGSKTDDPPQNAGCFKCNKCRVSCPKIQESQFFTSTNTQKKYRIKQKLNCDSDYVIYLATCRKCHGQYVGKSQTIFKKRHSNHKSEIKKNTGGLGHHYNEGRGGCGYENFTVILIEQVEVKTPKFLAEREVYWQHQLRVFIENGCRAHCYRKDV
jgi:hypothetical protein